MKQGTGLEYLQELVASRLTAAAGARSMLRTTSSANVLRMGQGTEEECLGLGALSLTAAASAVGTLWTTSAAAPCAWSKPWDQRGLIFCRHQLSAQDVPNLTNMT